MMCGLEGHTNKFPPPFTTTHLWPLPYLLPSSIFTHPFSLAIPHSYIRSFSSAAAAAASSFITTYPSHRLFPFATSYTHSDAHSMLSEDNPQDHVQAIRSVNKSIRPNAITPATPDEIYYVDTRPDPETQKEIVLWDDILQAFDNAVQVRHRARVLPFLKREDLTMYVYNESLFLVHMML